MGPPRRQGPEATREATRPAMDRNRAPMRRTPQRLRRSPRSWSGLSLLGAPRRLDLGPAASRAVGAPERRWRAAGRTRSCAAPRSPSPMPRRSGGGSPPTDSGQRYQPADSRSSPASRRPPAPAAPRSRVRSTAPIPARQPSISRFLDALGRRLQRQEDARPRAGGGADLGRAPAARARHAGRGGAAADRRRARPARGGGRGAGAAGGLPDRRLGRRGGQAARAGADRLLGPARLVVAQRRRGPGEPGPARAAGVQRLRPGDPGRAPGRLPAGYAGGGVAACPAPAEIVARR